jgi:hypothetical protein
MSGHFAAIIAIVGPPTYPAPKQQIDLIRIGIGALFTAAGDPLTAAIDFVFEFAADIDLVFLIFFPAPRVRSSAENPPTLPPLVDIC